MSTETCHVCGQSRWWTRPDGSPCCALCHPDPAKTKAQLAPLVGQRARLWDWGTAHGWPMVKFQPWATLVGDEAHWAAFCRNASDVEVEDVATTCGLEDLPDERR